MCHVSCKMTGVLTCVLTDFSHRNLRSVCVSGAEMSPLPLLLPVTGTLLYSALLFSVLFCSFFLSFLFCLQAMNRIDNVFCHLLHLMDSVLFVLLPWMFVVLRLNCKTVSCIWPHLMWSPSFSAGLLFLISSTIGSDSGGQSWMLAVPLSACLSLCTICLPTCLPACL